MTFSIAPRYSTGIKNASVRPAIVLLKGRGRNWWAGCSIDTVLTLHNKSEELKTLLHFSPLADWEIIIKIGKRVQQVELLDSLAGAKTRYTTTMISATRYDNHQIAWLLLYSIYAAPWYINHSRCVCYGIKFPKRQNFDWAGGKNILKLIVQAK